MEADIFIFYFECLFIVVLISNVRAKEAVEAELRTALTLTLGGYESAIAPLKFYLLIQRRIS